MSFKGRKFTDEHKKKLSLAKKGKPTWNKGLKGYNKNFPRTVEWREKISIAKRGARSHFWRGGLTKINVALRQTFEYKLWRESVYKRDNYTCIWCGLKGGWNKESKKRIILNADHIKPFALFPELRFAIDNGRTLCEDCHKTTNTWGVNKPKKLC